MRCCKERDSPCRAPLLFNEEAKVAAETLVPPGALGATVLDALAPDTVQSSTFTGLLLEDL